MSKPAGCSHSQAQDIDKAALDSARQIAEKAEILQTVHGKRALYAFRQNPHLIVIADSDASLDQLAVAIIEIAFISKAHELRHAERLKELDVSSRIANLAPYTESIQ
jgi:hypothetical protein